MSLSDQRPSVRFPLPDLIVRGKDHTISAPVYSAAALVEPSGATVSIFKPDNSALVTAAAATITDKVAQYTIAAATTNGQQLAEGYRVEWSLTVATATAPDGVILAINDAALGRRVFDPVISAADIWRRMRTLNPGHRSRIQSDTLQDELSESWTEIQHQLIDQGNRPNLIMSPTSLRRAHLCLAIAYTYENLGKAYAEEAMHWRQRYQSAWAELSFLYDRGDAGQADDSQKRRPALSGIWLL